MMTILLSLLGSILLISITPTILRWPILLVLVALVSMELNSSGQLDFAFFTVGNLMKTLLMIVFLVRLIIARDRIQVPIFLVHLIPFLVLAGIGVLHSEMFNQGAWHWVRWLYIWLFAIILSNVVTRERHILWISHALAVAMVLVAGLATSQSMSFFTGGPTLIEVQNVAMKKGLRASGGFFNPNTMAIHLVGMLIFIFAQFPDLKWRSWTKPFYIVAAVLAVVAIVLSQSRSGWLGLALGITLFLLSRHHRRIALPLLGIGFASFLVILLMTSFGAVLQSRLMSMAELGQDASGNVRMHLIYGGLEIFADGLHPIWGCGTYSFMAHIEGHLHSLMSHDEFYHTGIRMSHNLYITVLAEMGILGVAAFILFFRRVFKTISQLFTTYSSGITHNALVAILIYLIVKLVDFNLNPDFQDGLFWHLLGILGAITVMDGGRERSPAAGQSMSTALDRIHPATDEA